MKKCHSAGTGTVGVIAGDIAIASIAMWVIYVWYCMVISCYIPTYGGEPIVGIPIITVTMVHPHYVSIRTLLKSHLSYPQFSSSQLEMVDPNLSPTTRSIPIQKIE